MQPSSGRGMAARLLLAGLRKQFYLALKLTILLADTPSRHFVLTLNYDRRGGD